MLGDEIIYHGPHHVASAIDWMHELVGTHAGFDELSWSISFRQGDIKDAFRKWGTLYQLGRVEATPKIQRHLRDFLTAWPLTREELGFILDNVPENNYLVEIVLETTAEHVWAERSEAFDQPVT